jgi:CheY-like chemotaxis protein
VNVAVDTATATNDGNAAPRWRILIVEDSADDAELIGLELAEAGIDAECRLVDGEAGVLLALQSFAPHLVLSDVNMPGFCGQEAIEMARAHSPGIRFIFLSGASSAAEPALANAAIADAWLLKEDLAQLPALVRKLLAEV